MTNRRNQLNPLLGPWLAGAVLLGLPGSVLPVLAHADEPVSQVEQSASRVDGPLAQADQTAPRDAVRAALQKVMPGVEPDSVRPSPIANLYEVLIGPHLVYVSADGRYLLQGSIYDLETRQDLTEPRQRKAVVDAIDAVGEDKMIIFGEGDAQHTVTVVTDIDCGYCRKLHSEIDKFNQRGIRVRYLFFPRAGLNSDSYNKAVSVWCAEDRKKALTEAKAGKPVPPRTCDNPVRGHMALADAIGVSGTPAIILPGGKVIPGYVPPDRLAAYLALDQAAAK